MTTENEPAPEEPKIIVDEDWKSQVEREKEELKRQAEAGEKNGGQSSGAGSDQADQTMPPASFEILLSTLATQAMAAMGLLPDPVSGKPNPNRPLAKHIIDTIAVLEEKTKGNLTDDEAAQIEEALHQLRMIYVSSKNAPNPSAPATDEPKSKPPIIELP